MVQDQGIDVYLEPFHDITQRYPQHTVPAASPNFTGDPNEVYVEAVDGERFVVVVDLMEDFHSKGTHLRVGYQVDQDGFTTNHLSRSSLAKYRPLMPNLKGRDIFEEVTRKVDGDYVDCGFLFSLLGMDEEIDLAADETTRDAEAHGKVVVTVQRGRALKAKRTTLWQGYYPPDTNKSSKTVVHAKSVSHTVKHVILGKGTQPFQLAGDWVPLEGQKGDEIKFTIRYRSQDALQALKIIPKDQSYVDLTHSPPPSQRVKREPENDDARTEDIEAGMRPTNQYQIESAFNVNNSLADIRREFRGDRANEQTPAAFNQTPTGSAARNASTNPVGSAEQERTRKRAAMEDELKAVELEQKRMRLTQALAEI